MIKFRCNSCSKAIGVDEKHAGKQVKCPQCQTQLTIPTPELPVAEAIPVEAPPAPSAFDPFGDPSASAAGADDPFGSLPASSSFAAPRKVTAQPATPSPHSTPMARAPKPETSFGKNFAGLAAAAVVALVCSVVWLLIGVFTGREFGILAWAIGGLVGLISGVIAKNPSPVYCGLTAFIAGMAILGAKLIAAVFLMLASNMMDFAGMFDTEQIKEYAAIKSEMVDKKEFAGEEAAVARYEVTEFFVDSEVDYEEAGIDSDNYYEISEAVQSKVASRHKVMSDADISAMMERVKKKFPSWIEHDHDYQSAVSSLVVNNEIEDEKVVEYANYEMKRLDGDYDSEYLSSVSNNDRRKYKKSLRELAGAKLQDLGDIPKDEMLREAIKNHPKWCPLEDEYLAVLEKMHTEGKFEGQLLEHADYVIDEYLKDGGAGDYYDSISGDEYAKRDGDLKTQVNQEFVTLEVNQRKNMVRKLTKKYDDWIPYSSEYSEDDDLAAAEAELGELGVDGSFWSSIKAVFGILDVLWLGFGLVAAYTVAYKQGGGEE